jgi:cell division protein FtsI (penicillin-binding protein 3)
MLRRLRKREVRCRVVSETAAARATAPAGSATAPSRRLSGSANRLKLVALLFGAGFCALAGRLAYVSFLHVAPDEPSVVAAGPTDALRQEIVDRNGVLLATNLPTIALEVAGSEVWSPRETADALAAAFPEVDRDRLAKDLAARRYVEVTPDLTPAEQEEAFSLGLPGVRFGTRTKRFYPQEDLAAHVVGHVEKGRGGVMGLERALDDRSEAPLIASLDLRVQQIFEEELSATMHEFHAQAAFGAVMDSQTGEILALASLPDFDPNAPGAAPPDHRRNRVTYDRYELGSAFKPLIAAAALQAGTATPSSRYDARGALKIADRTIRDFHGENRVLSFAEVVRYSSNIGAARIAADLGVEREKAALKALGLFEALPIELFERRATELPARWGPVEAATVAYGHGISVTPLHLLAAFNAVVADGRYVAPTFVRAETPNRGRQVFSRRTSATMRAILRDVIAGGTAAQAEAPGYFPLGKTATAEKPARGRYDRNARIATFVGAFPGYAPRYTVLISLDDPKPTPKTYGYATAGWNAAPCFARFVTRAAPLLGLMPVDEAQAVAAFNDGYASASAAP